ncbi:MAG: hypothetical protein RLZZ261_927 [Bacteroidota bacterium]|jgi:23S rRNA (guanosine2251-2'-O)-methyltransferase
MSEQLDDQLIYGIRPIEEALESDVVLDRVFISQESRNPALMAIAAKARKKGIFVKFVPMERMQRFTRANHQGVVSWASSVAYADLSEVMAGLRERGVDPLVVVLDRVTDVRNVGAIARSCESFGAHTIVLSEGSAPMNADAVKSSAGALLRMPICRVRSLPIALTSLEMSGCQIVGISEKGTGTLADCDLRGPAALIMGSEEDGISPALWKACNATAKIPTSGETASLNVSVAAGIALYEASMQRRASN